MKTEKIWIISDGDPSVGIFPSRFEFGRDLEFDDEKELQDFMKMLSNLVESYVVGHPCYCVTEEQFQERENKILDAYKNEVPYKDRNEIRKENGSTKGHI